MTSRTRAPFKESWPRDLLRVKCDVTKSYVIVEVSVQMLR
jgi:hypothetical protein